MKTNSTTEKRVLICVGVGALSWMPVAIVAGPAVTAPTTASAANGRNFAAVVGLIAGAAIATAASNRGHGDEYSHRGNGSDDCFEKQTTRWNSYGERVTGYTTICR